MIGLGLGLGFGNPPHAAFTPLSPASLAAWYRADLGVSIATGVSAWADQSGTGDSNKNAVQVTALNQPSFNATDATLNNKPSIAGDGLTKTLLTGTWSTAIVQPFSWFVVGYDTNATSARQVYIEGDITSSFTSMINDKGDGTNTVYAGTGDVECGAQANGAAVILGADMNGASSKCYQSAITATYTGNTGTGGITGLAILGRSSGLNNLSGAIGEIVICDAILSDSERAALLHYFGTRYGITVDA